MENNNERFSRLLLESKMDYIPNQKRIRDILEQRIAMGGDFEDYDYEDDEDYGSAIPYVRASRRSTLNPWILHVKNVQALNPGMSYRDAMSVASDSYSGQGGARRKAVGWQGCRKSIKKYHPNRNQSLKNISTYYCKDNKKCYTTKAAKNRLCAKPRKTRSGSKVSKRKYIPIALTKKRVKRVTKNPWIECLKKLGNKGLSKSTISKLYKQGCKVPRGSKKKK